MFAYALDSVMSSTERVDSTSDSSFEELIEQPTETISNSKNNIIVLLIFNLMLKVDEYYNPLIPKIEEEKPLSIAELKMRYLRNHLLSKKADYSQDRQLS